MVASATSGDASVVAQENLEVSNTIPTESIETKTSIVIVEEPKEGELAKNLEVLKTESLTTEEQVRLTFNDAPIMANIAYCESNYRQFNTDGSVLRGRVNSKDVGLFQINEYYHLTTAQKLGIDIYTTEGNLQYGRYLYETQGTSPWIHSKPCWGKYLELAAR